MQFAAAGKLMRLDKFMRHSWRYRLTRSPSARSALFQAVGAREYTMPFEVEYHDVDGRWWTTECSLVLGVAGFRGNLICRTERIRAGRIRRSNAA
jgi:hypothetical protein